MSTYHIQEATFAIPPILKDRTVNLFSLTDSGASEVSFVITRDLVKAGLDLARYTERMLTEMEDRLSNFELVSRGTIEVGGRPASEVDCHWTSDGVKLFQRQVVCFVQAAPNSAPYALLITSTARQWNEKWATMFAGILQSLRFREIA